MRALEDEQSVADHKATDQGGMYAAMELCIPRLTETSVVGRKTTEHHGMYVATES